MNNKSSDNIKKEFKKLFYDEFNDPNESFIDFLLDLIPTKILALILKKGRSFYYSNFNKYK